MGGKLTVQDIKRLRELWGAFRPSRVLITANNLRVFDYLLKPLSAKELSLKLNTDPRATEILLDCLVSLGLLRKTKYKYQNRPIASRFLVTGSPYYQGNIIRHADTLWRNWSGLDEVIRTGRPYRAHRDHEAFILGMHDIAKLRAKKVIKALDLNGVKRVLDLGGGPGTYSIELARKGLEVTLFDLPETIKIASEIIKREKVNVNLMEGDFLVDEIGRDYDLIFISQVLHAYSEEDNLEILRKVRRALVRSGRVAIQEFYISKDKTSPLSSALFSVNMLVNTEGGRAYSPEEIKAWLKNTGFKKSSSKLIDDTVLIEARA
jgi:2-polyprenyl-3-methyl-5-hydroxy-6-metoxy-1,4-benzoquinol methylase